MEERLFASIVDAVLEANRRTRVHGAPVSVCPNHFLFELKTGLATTAIYVSIPRKDNRYNFAAAA